ncbi:MAG: tetratricopeptide repeat protein, partial [Oceanidesulfovibrio sp.]
MGGATQYTQNPADKSEPNGDVLAPYRDKPFQIYVLDRVLRDQLRVILGALKFSNVTVHKPPLSYFENARTLGQLLLTREGVFLVNPPAYAISPGSKNRIPKELTEYFETVKLVVGSSRRDVMKTLSKCVPVFTDIHFSQKRENTLITLAQYGITGAFILQKLESTANLSPRMREIQAKEQLMERYREVRDYLTEYLPHRESRLEELKERQEERELSARKAESDEWIRQGYEARAAGDWERAVQCFSKAIETYPQNPAAYMESGRTYVRLKRYPKALMRFAQAEEVAEGSPEPNKEIGMVRVLQAQDRIRAGNAADHPEVVALLDDALVNFQRSLDKAAAIKPLSDEDNRQRDVDAVTRIAGELMKIDLKSKLGKNHPAVKRLGAMARDAFNRVATTDMDELPAGQLIFLGLVAIEERNFTEAERLLFKAARDESHFAEACNEIIFMGTLVRKLEGPPRAIGIYTRLLELDPHNKAAVNFNLAVAYAVEHKELESAGAIVRGLMLEPDLAQNEMFYKNHQLYQVLETLVDLFDTVDNAKKKTKVPELVVKSVHFQERLERLIVLGRQKDALVLTFNLAKKIPEFFARESILANKTIAEFLQARIAMCKRAGTQSLTWLAGFL